MNHGERMFWVLIILRLPQTRHGEEKISSAIVQEVLLPIRPEVPIALNVQKAISQHMLALWSAIRVLQVMKVQKKAFTHVLFVNEDSICLSIEEQNACLVARTKLPWNLEPKKSPNANVLKGNSCVTKTWRPVAVWNVL